MPAKPSGPIIVNENGDVSFYRSASVACGSLEAIDVNNSEYEAFDLLGHRLILETRGYRVIMAVAPDAPVHLQTVDALVRESARVVGAQRLGISSVQTESIETIVDRMVVLDEQANSSWFNRWRTKRTLEDEKQRGESMHELIAEFSLTINQELGALGVQSEVMDYAPFPALDVRLPNVAESASVMIAGDIVVNCRQFSMEVPFLPGDNADGLVCLLREMIEIGFHAHRRWYGIFSKMGVAPAGTTGLLINIEGRSKR